MKRRELLERLLTIIELLLLAGIVLLSFYLIYGYLTQGEAASGETVVNRETRSGGEKEQEEETGEDEGEGGEEQEEEDGEDEEDGRERSFSASGLLRVDADDSTVIRVRILNSDYTSDLFEEIAITGADRFTVETGTYAEDYSFLPAKDSGLSDIILSDAMDDQSADVADDGEDSVPEEASDRAVGGEKDLSADVVSAGGTFTVSADDLREGEALHLTPEEEGTLTVVGLERSDGTPEYAGELYIYRLADGLALVNELSLQQYLYGVVSSEMPSWYPQEALKAQAVCARTFAWLYLENNKNEKIIADLDDSTRFQVYTITPHILGLIS